MSVKIMGLVWDLDNGIIDREEKYILLAYADHADHKGKNIFPSVASIAEKTGYKERATQMITKALHEKGFLVSEGKGPKGTNKWAIPLDDEGVRIAPAKNAPVQKATDGGAKPTVQGVHRNAPESLKPSSESSKEATPRGSQIPQVALFRSTTQAYPPKACFMMVSHKIDQMAARLGRDVLKSDLYPFYEHWCALGFKPTNLSWLDWAVSGVIPNRNGNGHKTNPAPVSRLSEEQLEEARREAEQVMLKK